MEKERKRAAEKGYRDPIQPNKEASDRDFNFALHYCLENISDIAICCGSHNEESSLMLAQLMVEKGLKDVLLTGGGIIPEEDNKALQDMGIGHLFAPGTNTTDIAAYIKKWVAENRKS
jgi:methylmalonyl-CoA mutase cobalamin-binding domain/chain